MAHPNPAINPPRLVSRISIHSRSPSRSPVRQARDRDPLVDLSPTTTLRTFTHGWDSFSAPSLTIDTASPAERALGVKAAQAYIDLRAWCRELESWQWPGTFDVPEPVRKKMRLSIMSLGTLRSMQDEDEDEHWGSLPARSVQAYDWRVDEICRDLDAHDMAELKRYALTAHRMSGGSIDDSISNIGPGTDLRRLDDFTALITATILQSLPYLSRLHRLLDVWTIRLSILRQTPAYLRDLKRAQTDLDHGWAAIAVSPAVGQSFYSANFTRGTMNEMHSALQRQVTSLGRRLDAFLDELEGQEETVPECWIEDLEILENAYSNWVVQAERRVVEDEWRAANEKDRPKATDTYKKAERSSWFSYEQEDPKIDRALLISPSSQSLSDISGLQHEGNESCEGSEPDRRKERLSESESSTSVLASEQQSPAKEAMHIPIVIDRSRSQRVNETEGSVMAPDEMTSLLLPQGSTEGQVKVSDAGAEMSRTSVAKKRAAFLNGDIERNRSLQKQAKTPVRPFEHASNAFSRLFRRDKSPGPSRSNSERSARSVGSKRSAKSDRDNNDPDNIVPNWHKKATSAPKSGAHEVKDERPRSSSRRSAGRVSAQSPLGDIWTGGRDVETDPTDPLGGFRPRSRSEEDEEMARGRSQTAGKYQPEARRTKQFRRSPVETYQPTRLESPFRPPSSRHQEEPEYPPDWPLASPPKTEPTSPIKEREFNLGNEPETTAGHENEQNAERGNDTFNDDEGDLEIHTPDVPIETDAFDRMFVQSFPGMRDVGETSRGESSQGLSGKRRKKKKADEPIMVDRFLQELCMHDANESMRRKDELQEEQRENSPLGQPTFGFLNADMSERGVPNEIAIDPAPVRRSPTSSRQSPCPDQQMPAVESPANTSQKFVISNLQKTDGPGATSDDEDKYDKQSFLIKHASVTNIESHPRASVRSIHVSRCSSVGSTTSRSALHTPEESSASVSAIEHGSGTRTPTSPQTYAGIIVFPSPPKSRPGVPTSLSPSGDEYATSAKAPEQTTDSNTQEGIMGLPVSVKLEEEMPSPAPLNSVMLKRRVHDSSDNSVRLPLRNPAETMTLSEDTFDRHVSEVIQRLPSAAIKFKARPGAETPVTNRTAETRSYTGPRPKNGRVPSRTVPGGLTLAPAEPSPKKSTADNEVKLYHLTQAGRDEPIKLFVRLVGDGERVMVRVGGGWADLADYLRQYAEHHGSRTVSGSGLEVYTAEGAGPSSRRVSGSSAIFEAKSRRTSACIATTPIVPRPSSRVATAGVDEDWLSQPQPKFTMGDDTDEESSPVLIRSQTPTSVNGTSRSTPRSTMSASRPSTADSAKRPVSRQGWSESGSLAGLGSAGKRSDMTEQKAKWVEDMIEKAKASAEKSRDEKAKYFGELGKVGGTRRVVFRANTGAINGAGVDGGKT